MNRRRQNGFGLIETLVTLFVVAIGLLSVAALQTISKKLYFDAIQRTTASQLTQEIVERMRANPKQLSAYVTDNVTAVGTPAVDCRSASGGCTPAQQAAFDLWTWSQTLQGAMSKNTADSSAVGGLAEPTGCIRVNGSVVTVVTVWRGLTPLNESQSASSETCGSGKSEYDEPGETAGNAQLRRMISISTIVADPFS